MRPLLYRSHICIHASLCPCKGYEEAQSAACWLCVCGESTIYKGNFRLLFSPTNGSRKTCRKERRHVHWAFHLTGAVLLCVKLATNLGDDIYNSFPDSIYVCSTCNHIHTHRPTDRPLTIISAEEQRTRHKVTITARTFTRTRTHTHTQKRPPKKRNQFLPFPFSFFRHLFGYS